MTSRQATIDAFLEGCGWGPADRVLLAADASFRRYLRLSLGGRRAVLMDAPPPKEDVRPFVALARHLRSCGYRAPAILENDATAGLLLLEDLGDATFTRLLAEGSPEAPLYRLGVDLLIDLGRHEPPSGLAVYDADRLQDEAMLLVDWTLPAIGIAADSAVRDSYRQAWHEVLPLAFGVAQGLVLRDFHVDNLMRLDDRQGLAQCGLLDFQDAVIGPVTYDLVSLLEDARRDVAPAVVAQERQRFLVACAAKASAFDASWACLAVQRHAKVIGIFTRLARRDGKPSYLRHMPRLWRLLERGLAHPGLAPVAAWFARHVPADERRTPAP
jgi:aminoglycoside/choline kinase family phosphotransferase